MPFFIEKHNAFGIILIDIEKNHQKFAQGTNLITSFFCLHEI